MRGIPFLEMAKVGAPTKYNPEFHPSDFIEKSKKGKTFAQIAASWDISRDTLWKWTDRHKEFSDAVKKGRELAEDWYMNLGQGALVGKAEIDGEPVKVDLGWHVWLTKNMFKWSDRQQMEHSGPDGKPIQTESKVSGMTDEQIKARIDTLLKKRKK